MLSIPMGRRIRNGIKSPEGWDVGASMFSASVQDELARVSIADVVLTGWIRASSTGDLPKRPVGPDRPKS